MGYSKSVEEWTSKPIDRSNKKMKELQSILKRCIQETEEKFVLIPLGWVLTDRYLSPQAHYLCLIVDVAPERQWPSSHMHVTIVDPNGYGASADAYKKLFTEPQIGLNILIKHMVTSLFTFACTDVEYTRLTVSFPKLSSINISTQAAGAAKRLDEKHFKEVGLVNTYMEKGVCSIVTLFVIIRVVCDQRKVLTEGIDKTIQRFTKSSNGITEYKHIMFVRSFIFVLMRALELDVPAYGISGNAYVVEKSGSEWSISKE